jgi:hypothetical protein
MKRVAARVASSWPCSIPPGKGPTVEQREELCFLLSLVSDPTALARDLRGRQRSWLRRREELLDAGHPAWSRLPNAEDARITLKILMDRR